jgi:hypothetical protein
LGAPEVLNLKTPFMIVMLSATLVVPFVAADAHGDCDAKGNIALGIVDIGGVAYIDDRNYLLGNGIWLYVESNGTPGLQRGGSSPIVPDDNENCFDDSETGPDLLIF